VRRGHYGVLALTALCGGGTSGPKPAVAAVVTYSSGLIALLLADFGAPWLTPVIPLLGLDSLVLSTFCGTDPPAIPTFTSAETEAILKLNFGADYDSGISKLTDLVEHLIWYDACQCTTGSPTTLPAAAAPPSGTPILVAPYPQATTACKILAPQGFTVTPSTGPIFAGQLSNVSAAGVILDVTSTRVTMHTSVHTSPGENVTFTVTHERVTTTTVVLDTTTFTLTPAQTIVVTIPWTVGAGAIRGFFSGVAGTGSTDATIGFENFCGGDVPGGETSPCCPPDPATQSSLDAILALVTLIQRQLAPFGTVHGASHTGLTGAGQLSVTGLIGVAVDLTTTPGRVGLVAGDPDTVFDVGWINVGTADGWGPRHFITSDPFVLSPVSGDVTLIGYSLPADVVATITELVREP
jgi:hypothetical protein